MRYHIMPLAENGFAPVDWTTRGQETDGVGKWAVQRNPSTGEVYVLQLKEAISTHAACSRLSPEKRCQQYDIRPIMCSAFPTIPDEIEHFDQCSFSFEIVGQWSLDACPYPAPGIRKG